MQLNVMTDKSAGGKGKLPENQDEREDKTISCPKSKDGNLNENVSPSDTSQDEQKKSSEKKVEIKPAIKINGVKNDSCRVRKIEDRKLSPAKPSRKPENKLTAVNSPGPPNKPNLTPRNEKQIDGRKSISDPGKAFTDDSRLSKLVRKIREADRERRLVAAKQLRDFLHTSEGVKAAIKVTDDILAILQDVLFERPYRDLQQEVAKSIGRVGSLLGQDGNRYLQMLFRQINNFIEDEIRCLYLQALFETLKNDEKKQSMAELMPMVMANVQTLLENANTSDLLMAVVNIIIYISKQYPCVFNSHFCDTVDILVGWHIDATQKDDIIQFTSEALISFHQFWTADLSFSVTLMGQFLEDMEAYAEDLNLITTGQTVVDEEISPPEDCIVKIGALLKVFTTVVKSLGDNFSPSKSGNISKEYIEEVFERILHSVENAIKAYYSEHVLNIVNQCLSLLVGLIPVSVMQSSDALLSFMLTQVFASKVVSHRYIATFTSLILKIIEIYAVKLPVSFLSQFLAPGSLLQECRFSHSEEVISRVLSIFHAILALKSVPLLEEAYKFVLGDIQQAYNSLLKHCGSVAVINVITANPFADTQYTITQAQTTCLFNLCALSEIANTKSNLIGMWALTPSVFNLLCDVLTPLQRDIAKIFPAIQYSVLHTLHSHCTRHGNFVSSSTILTQNTILEGSVMSAVNPTTSNHFARVLKLLTDLLEESITSYDARCLCLKWISDIIGSLHTSQHVFVMPEFVELVRVLIELGYNPEMQISVSVCQCMQNILKLNTNFPLAILKRCLKLSVSKISDGRFQIRDAYFQLMKLLPINLFPSVNCGLTVIDTRDNLAIVSENLYSLQNVWSAKRNHINRIPLGTFHSHNFSQVMGFILHHQSASQAVNFGWLEMMYHSSQRSNKEDGRGDDLVHLADVITGSEPLLWFWATWEAAQFCVLARLRTPLGKPQDTFTSIEGELKSYAAELKLHDEEVEPSKEKVIDLASHLRVSLLLQFMEHLEKLLYNAYEGCAVAMPTSPKTVRAFFRTNKKTCLEWLSRIRSTIISVALSCGKPAMAIRHSFELLKEMKENGNTQGCDFEQVVIWLVQALSDLQQPDSLLGIYNWCREVTGKKHSWIKAAAEKAYGRFESAAKEYKSAVRSMVGGDGHGKDRDSPDGSPRPAEDNNMQRKFTGILSKQSQTQAHAYSPIQKINFVVNEVVDCYMKLNDWESVLDWQETVAQYRQDKTLNSEQSAFTTCVDINYIKALSSFESEDVEYTKESLELVPGASLSDLGKTDPTLATLWNPKKKLDYAHIQFLRVATAIQGQKHNNYKTDIGKNLIQAEKLIEGVLRIASLDWPVLMSHDSMTILSIIATIRRQLEDKRNKTQLLPLSEEFSCGVDGQDVGCYLNAMKLVNLQYNIPSTDTKLDLMSHLLQLQLTTASLARKQHNYLLSESMILQQANSLLVIHTETGQHSVRESLLSALGNLKAANGGINQMNILKIERETAKLLNSTGQYRDAIEIISGSAVGYICAESHEDTKDHAYRATCRELCSRSLLTLVKWLQLDHKNFSSVAAQLKFTGQGDAGGGGSITRNNLKVLLEREKTGMKEKLGLILDNENEKELNVGDSPILADTDGIIGRLLHLSAMESPSLSKSWFILAGWCYKWGRKAVDNASHGSVELSIDEKAQVLSLLPKGTSSEEKENILGILSQIHTALSSEEDISDHDQYDDGAETTRRQLLSCLSLQIASDDCVDRLLSLWKGVVWRVYHYYQLSAKAYFTYLHLNGDNCSVGNNEDGNVIATLRLLRLLVKHAWELRSVLECGLANTPTAPWKGIIPQLFSRLSHPEAYVRQSVSELLCRVAQDAPHLIVYPAVVGCSTTKLDIKTQNQSGLLNEYLSQSLEDGEREEPHSQENDEDDFDLADDSTSKVLQNCLTSIVDSLSHQNPRMISEVTQLVHELRRITLLWDELWLGTLNQHHQDVTRRIGQLENEIKKVDSNSNLGKEEKMAIIREKHKTVMKPTLYTIEKLQEITSQTAETPHEIWFQETYGRLIDEAMEKLQNPSSPAHPLQSWHLFKQLHLRLQQRAQKRNSLLLKMDDISPKLDELKNTVIAMPGLGTTGQVVTMESVLKSVQILPTKTKPKKLVFRGSDGKKYPYLFKGLEDLHLDERIMQFLSIVNNMFVSANKGSQPVFRARHYSVTPLGPRSGLIQWVDGATPLFGLYKRWQQREALAQSLKNSTSGNSHTSSNNAPNIPRPSELYYSKLTPALREKGISSQETNRKDWPQSLLRKVLEELISDTPADLLARELWCSSTGPNEWWHITQTYSRSTAVMSMIGYIIGLGDRHLDNVLVDLATGEVVHIDYNVCFEKGKGLRVPEKVPFRMTQNIESALGLTGIEGTFRSASEHVIKTMRKGRETLLTLLEAFVYDPLVDWTTGNEGGYTGAFYGGGLTSVNNAGDGRQTKGEIEREITVSMFSIRMAEMKISWMNNRDEMISCLPKLQDQMQSWMSVATDYYASLGNLDSFTEVQTMVSDSLGDPSHLLFTLKDRYSEYSVIKLAQDEVQTSVEEKINEYSHWQKVHRHVIETLNGQAFQKMCSDLSKPLNPGIPCFSVAKDFLNGVGQTQIVTQCEQLENEMTGILQVQRANLHRTMEILHTYATIVTQFGSHFADQNRTNQYLRWLQELVCDFTSDKCGQIKAQFHDLYGNPNVSPAKKQLVLNTEAKLQNIISDVTGKLHKLLERRNQESAETAFLECQVKENENNIQLFLQENTDSGANNLMGVIITALCSLNKRYLQMEGAAAGAGDRLMDLTSRDGDWFLDELCSMSGNVIQFLHMLKLNTVVGEIENFQSLHQALTSTHNVYISLHELNLNFRTIILPEALKTIQSQDTSVCCALENLEKLLSEVGQPLDKLVSQLELLHRNAIMGIENDNMAIIHIVHKMQQQFMSLLEGTESGSAEMTPGQMLLMGFNGLFTQLDNEFAELLESIDGLQVPDIWRKVDAIRDAKTMQLSSFSVNTRGMLTSMFFVKRLQAIQEFFHMCTQFAATLQGLEGGSCYDDEQMSKPIKKFIAEYVRKQVIGFPSQILGYILCVLVNALGVNVTAEIELKDVGAESKMPLEDLCKKAVDTCLRNRQFQHIDFTQAGALTTSQDTSWRRHDLARRLDSNIELVRASLQSAQLQLARLQWLQEDVFIQAGHHHNQMVMPNRATIMSEMRKSMQSLVGPETTMMACQARYNVPESSILQRLRWAAGANPSVNLALQQFEEASAFRKQVCEDEVKWSQEIVNLCQGILHMEALRTRTPEAVSSDTSFINLMTKCSDSCIIAASASSSVSEHEVLLMTSWPPADGQSMDIQWLQRALQEITAQVAEVKKKVATLKSDLETAKDEIKSEVQNIRSSLTVHHKLMSDIRTILKSMAKQEEQEYGEQVLPGGIRQYLNLYKNFSENFTTALKMVISEDITKDGMAEAFALLSDLRNQVTEIYDDLVSLAPPLLTKNDGTSDNEQMNFATALKKPVEAKDVASPGRPLSLYQKDLLMNTPPGSPQSGLLAKLATPSVKKIDKITRDPRTGKAIQERNSYAVGVWRRVKMKLDGRDPDINKRLSVAEQVDNVIKEATSMDNLAVLYEGWTPWV